MSVVMIIQSIFTEYREKNCKSLGSTDSLVDVSATKFTKKLQWTVVHAPTVNMYQMLVP